VIKIAIHWECDRCGKQEIVAQGDVPDGWVECGEYSYKPPRIDAQYCRCLECAEKEGL